MGNYNYGKSKLLKSLIGYDIIGNDLSLPHFTISPVTAQKEETATVRFLLMGKLCSKESLSKGEDISSIYFL